MDMRPYTTVGAWDQVRHGVQKIFIGEFRDDLFFGRGVLRIDRGAEVQKVKNPAPSDKEKKKRFAAMVDPTLLVRFEGTFASSWDEEFEPLIKTNRCPARFSAEAVDNSAEYKGTVRMFFGDENGVQVSGPRLTDYSLLAYTCGTRDVSHCEYGIATYADESVYKGSMVGGWPEGQFGRLQWPPEDGRDPTRRIEYYGDFKRGMMHGYGRIEYPEGTGQVTYEGQWQFGQKHGRGQQIIPPSAQPHYGYENYDGEWEEDMRSGHGTMTFGGSTGKLLKYIGDFQGNNRHGIGRIEMRQEVVLRAEFIDDNIDTKKTKAWVRLDTGAMYHGDANANGEAEGRGQVYMAAAMDEVNFATLVKQCMGVKPDEYQ